MSGYKYSSRPDHIGSFSNIHGTAYHGVTTGRDILGESSGGKHGQFRVRHEGADGGYISGTIGSDEERRTYDEWPSNWRLTGSMNWPDAPVRVPSKEWLSTQLYADTNPSKPSFDIPRAIGELKDLPGMLKGIGDGFISKGLAHAAGHLNLTYSFGWAPFFRDVVALFTCQELITKRFDEFRALKKEGTTLRKRTLFQQTASNETGYGVNDFWKMKLSCERTVVVRGYTIWNCDDDFPSTDEALRLLAMQCALGLSVRFKTSWDLLPWSWAIDWFANVGTFLEAKSNTAGLSCSLANLMLHETVTNKAVPREEQDRRSDDFHLNISPMIYKTETKSRFPAGPPTLAAQLPILTDSQLGILDSIAVTRKSRR